MSHRSKKPPTRKAIDYSVRRLVLATRVHQMRGTRGPNRAEAVREFDDAWLSLGVRLDVLFKRQEELLEVIAEAYVAAGSLLIDLDAVDSEHGTKLLDNLAAAKLKHKDVIPFPSFKDVKP